MKHPNPDPIHFLLIFSLLSLLILQPAGARDPIDVIEPGGIVFIGESGLDITAAVPAGASIAWWAWGADINVTAPSQIVFISDCSNFAISPSDFVGYPGNWYVYTGSPPVTTLAFVVQDPSLDLRIGDVTTGTDITNGVIAAGDEIEFEINSNLYPPEAPVSINITAPDGSYYSALVNKSGDTTPLSDIIVSSQPFRTGAVWDTSNALYPEGMYSVRTECNMNGMKDNYKNAGADYIGKTVSLYYTITLISPTPVTDQDGGNGDSGTSSGSTTSSVATAPDVTAGTAATFTFAPVLTATTPAGITGVQLVTTRTLGQTEITVTAIPARTLSGLDGQAVAGYVDIVAIGVNPNAIDHATITVSVSRDWLAQQGLTPSDVAVAYDNEGVWTYLPTTYTGETGDSCSYTMTTPNLGYFAITVVKTGIDRGIAPAPKSGISPAVAASQSYSLGFSGMSFNTDGQNTLDISRADAQAAGATVTVYFNRIEVYQHHSPGATITFWGNNFTITRDRIGGTVSRAEFATDPVDATLDYGNVSGSVHALLPRLTERALITTTISESVSADTLGQFREITSRNSLTLGDVAYTLEVRKVNLTTGPANVTFTVPASWVNPRGGSGAVHITRISGDTRKIELLSTTYGGISPSGTMIFRGDSPDGTSIFGLITAKAIAMEQEENPNMTYVPASKPAIETDVRMFGWLLGTVRDNTVLLVTMVAVLALLAYFRLYRKQF